MNFEESVIKSKPKYNDYYEPKGLVKELLEPFDKKTLETMSEAQSADIDIQLIRSRQAAMTKEVRARSEETIQKLLELHGEYKKLPRKRKCFLCKSWFQPPARFVYYCGDECFDPEMAEKLKKKEIRVTEWRKGWDKKQLEKQNENPS